MPDLDFCYAVLDKGSVYVTKISLSSSFSIFDPVSRSFAVVIQQLPEMLKDAVCIFYLVLRGLDSVEDDMTFPNDQKVLLLLVSVLFVFVNNYEAAAFD